MSAASRFTKGGARYYKIGESTYPSVTSILSCINKPYLAQWKSRLALESFAASAVAAGEVTKDSVAAHMQAAVAEPEKRTWAAQTHGTQAHAVLDDIVLKSPAEVAALMEAQAFPSDMTKYVRQFEDFRQKTGITLISQDTVVYSDVHGYAGAFDALGRTVDGRLVIIDWKTTTGIRPEYAMQLSAYAAAYEELTAEPVSSAVVVRFSKTEPVTDRMPRYEVRSVRDLASSFETFLAARRLWSALQGGIGDWFESTKETVECMASTPILRADEVVNDPNSSFPMQVVAARDTVV
jgi:hypothetical protein